MQINKAIGTKNIKLRNYKPKMSFFFKFINQIKNEVLGSKHEHLKLCCPEKMQR